MLVVGGFGIRLTTWAATCDATQTGCVLTAATWHL